MKRVWRFLALLSVTPIMAVVCVVVLGWMTLRVVYERSRSEQRSFIAEVVRNIDEVIAERFLLGQPYESRDGETTYYVVRREGNLIAVKSLNNATGIEPLIEVIAKPTPGPTGWFAVTQLRYTLKATPIWKETTEDHWKRVDRVAAELSKSPQFARVAHAMKNGSATESRVLMGGYFFNAVAIAVLLFGLRSLVWLWRGVKWPWGNQEAWKENRGGWRAWFNCIAFSPLLTLACVVAIFEMTDLRNTIRLGNHVRDVRYWMLECREGYAIQEYWLVVVTPRGTQFEATRVNIPEDKVGDIQLFSNKDGVAVIRQITQGEYGWPANMRNMVWVEIDSVSTAPVDEAIVMKTADEWLRSKSGGFQENERLDVPYRIDTRWSGVLYNAVALLIACVACWSAQWLWRGWRIPTRRRDDHCQICGYSLVGLNADKCPECGTAVPIRAPQRGTSSC